jgi:hypothetical protein
VDCRGQLLVDDLQRSARLLCCHEQLTSFVWLLVDLAVIRHRLKQLLPLRRVWHKLLDGATAAESTAPAQERAYNIIGSSSKQKN